MQPEAVRSTLIDALLPAAGLPAWTRKALLALAGSLLLTLSARINVPFYPVPMTMQTFAVLVIGAAFGWRLGAATVLLYLAQGALGLPVFAGTPEKGHRPRIHDGPGREPSRLTRVHFKRNAHGRSPRQCR